MSSPILHFSSPDAGEDEEEQKKRKKWRENFTTSNKIIRQVALVGWTVVALFARCLTD
jgi:hypothetical protein